MKIASQNDIKSLFGEVNNTYKIYIVGDYTEDSLDEYLLLKELSKLDLSSINLNNYQEYMQEHEKEIMFDVLDFNTFGHPSSQVGIDIVGATDWSIENEKLQIFLPYSDVYICIHAQWE